MADLQTIPTNGNTSQLTGIAQLLQSLNGIAGTGKTTTSSSTDPGTNDAINALLASINGGGSDEAINGVIQNIFNQGKQALGTTLFQGAGGGAYNSTTQQQLAGDTLAKTVAAASAAKLQAQQQSQETAAKLLAAQASANRVTKSQTAASPFAKALGPAVSALSLYSKLKGTGKGDGLLDKLFKSSGTGEDLGSGALPSTVDSSAAAGNDVGFDAFGNSTSDLSGATSSLPDLSTGASSGELFDASGALADATAASDAEFGTAGALSSGVGDSALTGTAIDFTGVDAAGIDAGAGALGGGAAGEVGTDIGAGLAGEAAGDVAVDAGAGALAGEAAGEVAADEGIGELALAVSAAAICQESVRQGLMDAELYKQETIIGAHKLGKTSVRGYHYLAIPWVLKMRKNRQLAVRLSIWAIAYANFIAYDKNSIRAMILQYLGRPVCFCVGLFVSQPDLRRLQIAKGVV